jgi:hypothetical protein
MTRRDEPLSPRTVRGNVIAVLKNYNDGDIVSVSMHQWERQENERFDVSGEVKLFPGERYYISDVKFEEALDGTEPIERLTIKGDVPVAVEN